jgi:hypothetical protein
MGNPPDVPNVADPNTVAANQQKLNTSAAQASQRGSMTNQVTPYGSLTYQQTGTASDGTPLYTATTSLTPEQQNLVNLLTGSKTTAGTQAGKLLTNANYGSGNYSDIVGDATKGLTKQAMDTQVKYLDPYFQTQTDQLDTRLRNQGLTPADPGYKIAMNNLKQSQGSTVTGYLSQIEPQMYQQATASYLTPLTMATALGGYGSPTNPTFQNTPQLNIQPANLIGATANAQNAQMDAYKAENDKYGNMMSGIMGIPTSILGGWAQSGGLSSLMGAMSL